MLAVRVLTSINWQWYVLIGSWPRWLAGMAVSQVLGESDG